MCVFVCMLMSDEVPNDASDEQSDQNANTAKEQCIVVGRGVCGCFAVVVCTIGLLLAYGTHGTCRACGTLGAYKRRACGAGGTSRTHGA